MLHCRTGPGPTRKKMIRMKKFTQKEFSELLEKFLTGAITAAEKERLFDRLATPRARELFEELSRVRWDAASGEMDESLKRKMLKEIRREIAPRAALGTRFRSAAWARVAAAAAIAALAGAGGYLAHTVSESGKEYRPFTVSVDSGQKANVVLPDGTIVWLNSMSVLSCDFSRNQKERRVTLDGECYFEVARDPSRRFVVETQGIEVEALGTAFDVKSYSDDEEIVTGVRRGRVRVTCGQEAMELEPEQKSVYRKSDGLLLRSPIADMTALDFWRSGILVFESAPLSEIAVTVERMYGVRVEFGSEEIKRISFTGTISNNSISNIFYLISLTYPISYTIEGGTVRLDAKRR